MDPFSLATGLAGLVALASSILSVSYKYGSAVINGNKTVKSLATELRDIRTVLENLEALVQDANISSTPYYPKASSKLNTTVMECRSTLQELHEKLQKRQEAGKIKSALYRLTWPLTESDTLDVVNSLARYKSTLQLALSVDTW